MSTSAIKVLVKCLLAQENLSEYSEVQRLLAVFSSP